MGTIKPLMPPPLFNFLVPEPQRGDDPTPDKYICIMDLSLLG